MYPIACQNSDKVGEIQIIKFQTTCLLLGVIQIQKLLTQEIRRTRYDNTATRR